MAKFEIGVCTWSLRKPIAEVIDILDALGVDAMHLALDPALRGDEAYFETAKASGKRISSTMIGFPWEDYSTLETIRETGGIAPDEHWPEALALVKKAAPMTAALGAPYISFHAGFIDHDNPARRFLEELAHPKVFLNLDPANLILYNKDKPLEALPKLAPWVRHVHAKDAIHTQPGQWGREVPWGEGEVNIYAFMAKLEALGFAGTMAIEREAGSTRVADIAKAVRRLRAY